ncbi:MAG: DUF2442 domain-containing protein, partial [Caldilinea sp.]|nr:DUF2442 domain-containing protein [Caldilinea sp.]
MDRLLHPSSADIARGYHAADPLTWPPEFVLAVTGVEHVAGYRLRLTFSDGYAREIDFEPFLTSSVHPQIRQFLDLENFLDFRLEDGD